MPGRTKLELNRPLRRARVAVVCMSRRRRLAPGIVRPLDDVVVTIDILAHAQRGYVSWVCLAEFFLAVIRGAFALIGFTHRRAHHSGYATEGSGWGVWGNVSAALGLILRDRLHHDGLLGDRTILTASVNVNDSWPSIASVLRQFRISSHGAKDGLALVGRPASLEGGA